MSASRPSSPARDRRRGFTLVELAVVCAVTIAGTVVLGRIFVGILDVHAAEEERVDLVQMGRAAAELMTSELRLARSFAAASAASVEFVAGTGSGETSIRYSVVDPGSDGLPPIYLDRAAGATVPADGQAVAVLVDASGGVVPPPASPRLEFRYHDAGGAAIPAPLGPADLSRIRLVGITMTLQGAGGAPDAPAPPRSVTLRWAVAVRNMD